MTYLYLLNIICDAHCFIKHISSVFLEQFVLDMHFIVEIANHGGYFSNNTLILVNLMKSALLSAGLDLEM